jgi:hypothetical protein
VPPTTVWIPDFVVVSWTEPENNGALITAYTIYLRSSDFASYSTVLEYCDGTDPIILAAKTCTIPVQVFKASPFNLPWGGSVFAKVVAINSEGPSVESNPNNGAHIITNPDPPINLQEVYSQRSKSTLALSWTEAPFNGGTPVIDYTIKIA